MYLLLVEAEPVAVTSAADGAPGAAATVLVNHHDPAVAEHIARTALSEHGWLLRSVVRSRALVGKEISEADTTLAPFIKQATSEGVAFDIALLPRGLNAGDAVVEPWLMRRFEGDVDAAPDYPS